MPLFIREVGQTCLSRIMNWECAAIKEPHHCGMPQLIFYFPEKTITIEHGGYTDKA